MTLLPEEPILVEFLISNSISHVLFRGNLNFLTLQEVFPMMLNLKFNVYENIRISQALQSRVNWKN